MLKTSYLGYDTETNSDVTNEFNPITQIGFKRYDEHWEAVDGGETALGKLGLNYANPHAIAVHGLSPSHLQKGGLTQLEMAAYIDQTFTEEADATVFGYNSHYFDDKVVRHALFVNGRNPYTISNSGAGNSVDIYKMVTTASALKSDAITYGIKDNGKPSYKLETLSEVNGVKHESAHDALSDVDATAGIAKKIIQNDPATYNTFQQGTDADSINAMFQQPDAVVARITASQHGVSITPILPVIPDAKNANLVHGIRLDKPKELAKVFDRLTVEDIEGALNKPLSERPKGFKATKDWPFVSLKILNGQPLVDITSMIPDLVDNAKILQATATNKAHSFVEDYEADPDVKPLTDSKRNKMFAKMEKEFLEDDVKQANVYLNLPSHTISDTLTLIKDKLDIGKPDSLVKYVASANKGRTFPEPENYTAALYTTTIKHADTEIKKALTTPDNDSGTPPIVDADIFKTVKRLSSDHDTHLTLLTALKYDHIISREDVLTPKIVVEVLDKHLQSNPSQNTAYEIVLYSNILKDRLDSYTDIDGHPITLSEKFENDFNKVLESKPDAAKKTLPALEDARAHNRMLEETVHRVYQMGLKIDAELPVPTKDFVSKFSEVANVHMVKYHNDDYRAIAI